MGITLVTTGVIGAALATYLSLTGSQNQMTQRSQAWNTCIPVAEAGVEEALAHLNANKTNQLATQGWTLVGNLYSKSNAVGRGNYRVTISKTRPFEIISIGYYPFGDASAIVSRTLKVNTKDVGVFIGAIVAKTSITLNGNNVAADSYDSTDPTKSTGGLYDPAKAGDDADVAFTGSMSNLGLGNANIWGKLYSAPSSSFNLGPNGAVGSVAWNKSGAIGIEPGWQETDLNYTFVDVQKPFVSGVPPTSGTVNGTYYEYILGDGQYEASTLGSKVLVAGKAVLYVSGDIKFTGQDRIDIMNGATLAMYVAGASAEFLTINNSNKTSKAFQYYGLPTNTSMDWNGTQLHGAIYAPQATINLHGTSQIFASLVAKNVTFSGNASIHYDESLVDEGLSQGFVVSGWDEL